MATSKNNKSTQNNKTSPKTTKSTNTTKNTKTTKAKTPSPPPQPESKPIRRELLAAVCVFLAALSILAIFGVEALLINLLAIVCRGLFGWGFYVLPFSFLICAAVLAFHRGRPVLLRSILALCLPIFVGAMAHMLIVGEAYAFSLGFVGLVKGLFESGKLMTSGGLVCGLVSLSLQTTISIYGGFPLLFALFVFALFMSLNLSFAQLSEFLAKRKAAKAANVYSPYEDDFKVTKKKVKKPEFVDMDFSSTEPNGQVKLEEKSKNDDVFELFNSMTKKIEPKAEPELEKIPESIKELMKEPVKEPVKEIETPISQSLPTQIVELPPLLDLAEPVKISKEEMAQVKAEVAMEIELASEVTGEYVFPPLELLRKNKSLAVDAREEIAINRERLEAATKSFNVSAKVVGATRGPTVTRYDLELDVGVKLSKLMNLSNDLALALGVSNVRIAPIAGKISTVGIEVPNKSLSLVSLREIVESNNFIDAKSKLSFAIGKDIGGNVVVGNISKLPHMLIAGTTGSGKSVCINSLLLSLIYKSSPEELRLIMIDPKMVELGIYNGIPHLFVPVVTDPKKAAGALQWAVVEMLKRYRLFADVGVRDLEAYNNYQRKNEGKTLPQIVIVVDELADLMICAAKEVEESICRVAQMGRASGMHLIIATQRPSADVITGLMKANIPSRIAFAVSSSLESRIILDTQGAEKLIGNGDMLYAPLGSGKPQRVQGAFVSDDEREEVISFIKNTSKAEYSDEVMQEIEKAAAEKNEAGFSKKAPKSVEENSNNGFGEDFDVLLTQAVEVLLEAGQASVSMLQRRLKIGFSRAGRIIDQMEELGIVGPPEGSKPRQILITKQKWQEYLVARGGGVSEELELDIEFSEEFDDIEEVE